MAVQEKTFLPQQSSMFSPGQLSIRLRQINVRIYDYDSNPGITEDLTWLGFQTGMEFTLTKI